MLRLTFFLIFVAVSIVFPLFEAQAQRYVDPRVSMSGYRSWCAAQGGTVDLSGGVGCRVTRAPSGYGGGAQSGAAMGQALGQAMAPLFYQFGQQIGCMLIGGCRDPQAVAEAQRRAAQIEAEARSAEAERLRKEEEARRKFQEAQQRMLGELRGYEFDGLQLRGLEGSQLQVEPRGGAFGVTELKPRELQVTSALSGRGRVRCAVSLLYKANKAYVDINTQSALWEAAYLSNEAANIASSASHRPAVQCPPDPPVIGTPVATREAEAQLQRIQQSAILFARVQQKIADIETQKASIQRGEAEVKEGEQKIAELRQRVEQFQQKPVTTPPASGVPGGGQQQDDGALAEALAALKQAEEAYQSSRQLVQEQQGQLADMQRELNGSMKQLQGTMKSWSNFDPPSGPRG